MQTELLQLYSLVEMEASASASRNSPPGGRAGSHVYSDSRSDLNSFLFFLIYAFEVCKILFFIALNHLINEGASNHLFWKNQSSYWNLNANCHWLSLLTHEHLHVCFGVCAYLLFSKWYNNLNQEMYFLIKYLNCHGWYVCRTTTSMEQFNQQWMVSCIGQSRMHPRTFNILCFTHWSHIIHYLFNTVLYYEMGKVKRPPMMRRRPDPCSTRLGVMAALFCQDTQNSAGLLA